VFYCDNCEFVYIWFVKLHLCFCGRKWFNARFSPAIIRVRSGAPVLCTHFLRIKQISSGLLRRLAGCFTWIVWSSFNDSDEAGAQLKGHWFGVNRQ
jgi:hypothetical protein